jgi:poly(A) polymerase
MREIWVLQPRLEQTRGGRAKRLLTHPRFRAAYDFLLLRAACGEVPQALADWWTQAQGGDSLPPVPAELDEAVDEGGAAPARRKRRRRGGRGRRPGAPAPTPAS